MRDLGKGKEKLEEKTLLLTEKYIPTSFPQMFCRFHKMYTFTSGFHLVQPSSLHQHSLSGSKTQKPKQSEIIPRK